MSTNKDETILLAEYAAAHSSFHHYDGFRWQAGSMLIASSLVLWGFLLSKEQPPLMISVAGVLISILMSCWILFSNHYRQLYMSKLHRIHEIEAALGMSLNIKHGFLGLTPSSYPKFGPKGHNLDIVVF